MVLPGVICLAIALAFSTAQNTVRLRPEDNYDEPPETFQCQDELYEYDASEKGEVYSPFYKTRANYYDNLWCQYKITAPEGYRIRLTFKDLDIVPSSGCSQDHLLVYGKESVLGIFCGSQLPYPILSVEGESEIVLLFGTDVMASARGFSIQYESSPSMELCDAGHSACRNRKCYDSAKKCDGVDDCGDGTDEEECGFPLVLNPEQCGTTIIEPKTVLNSDDRIVGGEPAIPNSWPWQVSLQQSMSEPNGHFCGGTLINAQWVVTAAHCVSRYINPSETRIHVGSHYKFKKTKYEQIRIAQKIIGYPDREFEKLISFSTTHDIALIKLNAPVKFNDGVQPACLPSSERKLTPKMSCYATGWGQSRGSGADDQLKQTEQYVQSPQTCGYNHKTQICVSKTNNSPCQGDSGGPLSCKLEGKWYVFGATSVGVSTSQQTGLCAGSIAKTMYASFPEKIDWIWSIVNKYS